MTAQGDHVVLKCSNGDCGMRYPSPADDPRRNACPLCEAPVAQLASYTDPPLQQLPSAPGTGGSLVGVLDSIRSALNVGTMLRSADGAGLTHLYLGGLTARADNPKVIKTALGAQESVPNTSGLDVVPMVEALISQGFEVWAVDFTPRSVSLQGCIERPAKLAFVVGNERAGVDPEVLAMAHRHVHLDMHGAKTTLNVGVAFGVVAHWLRALPSATN